MTSGQIVTTTVGSGCDSGVTNHNAPPTVSPTTRMPLASANHFNCSRSTSFAARNRTTTATAPASSVASTIANPAANITPVGSQSTAYGLWPTT